MSQPRKDQITTAAEHKLQTGLEQCGRRIDLALSGIQRAERSAAGYACVAGVVARAAKALLPHGGTKGEDGFLVWVKQRFPGVSHRTVIRYMEFSEAIEAKVDTVSTLAGRLIEEGAKGFTKSDERSVIDCVPEAMGGESMTRVLKDHQAAKRAAEAKANPPKRQSKTALARKKYTTIAHALLSNLRVLQDPKAWAALDRETQDELEAARIDAGRTWKGAR